MSTLAEGLGLLAAALSKFDAYADEVDGDDETYSLVVETMNGIEAGSARLACLLGPEQQEADRCSA